VPDATLRESLRVDADGQERLLYKVHEVAKLLGLGDANVYRLIRDGTLPALRVGGVIRVHRDAIAAFIEALPGYTAH